MDGVAPRRIGAHRFAFSLTLPRLAAASRQVHGARRTLSTPRVCACSTTWKRRCVVERRDARARPGPHRSRLERSNDGFRCGSPDGAGPPDRCNRRFAAATALLARAARHVPRMTSDLDFHRRALSSGLRRRDRVRALASLCIRAPVRRGKRVLDAACGEGYGTALARHEGGRGGRRRHRRRSVRARTIAPTASATVRFVAGSCTELPLPDASFDVDRFVRDHRASGRRRPAADARRVRAGAEAGGIAGHFVAEQAALQRRAGLQQRVPSPRALSRRLGCAAGARRFRRSAGSSSTSLPGRRSGAKTRASASRPGSAMRAGCRRMCLRKACTSSSLRADIRRRFLPRRCAGRFSPTPTTPS